MITDDDVKKLKTVFATKEDLKGFATNKRLDEVNERLANAIVETRVELRSFKEEVRSSFEQNTSRILEAIDAFAGEIKDHRMKESIHNQKHDDIVDRLDKIEKVSVVAYELK